LKKSLSSHPLWVWTFTPSVFTGGEERAERFPLYGPVRVSVTVIIVIAVSIGVPVRGHGREAHPGRDAFEARSSRSISAESVSIVFSELGLPTLTAVVDVGASIRRDVLCLSQTGSGSGSGYSRR
jgi:hypothetical protein